MLFPWELFEDEIKDGIKTIVQSMKDDLLELAQTFKGRQSYNLLLSL